MKNWFNNITIPNCRTVEQLQKDEVALQDEVPKDETTLATLGKCKNQ